MVILYTSCEELLDRYKAFELGALNCSSRTSYHIKWKRKLV